MVESIFFVLIFVIGYFLGFTRARDLYTKIAEGERAHPKVSMPEYPVGSAECLICGEKNEYDGTTPVEKHGCTPIMCVTTTPLESPAPTPVPTYQQVTEDLKEFDSTHKARYANNHSKRDSKGKFTPKKKRRSMAEISKDIKKNRNRSNPSKEE